MKTAAAVAFAVVLAGCVSTAPSADPPGAMPPPSAATPPQVPPVAVRTAVEPAAAAATSSPVPAPVESAPPRPPVPFERAVLQAADQLFDAAYRMLAPTGPQRELVVDPLFDAATGQQTAATRGAARMLVDEVSASRPWLAVRTFEEPVLARAPLLLTGTLTAIDAYGDADARSNTFALSLVLVDLARGQVVARAYSRASEGSVDATPTAFFRDAPGWRRDRSLVARVTLAHPAEPGGRPASMMDLPRSGRLIASAPRTYAPPPSIPPAYLAGLPLSALRSAAIVAYEERRYRDALSLFQKADKLSDADPQVLNGLYLCASRLGRAADAQQALARLIAQGLDERGVSLALRFAPASDQFAADAAERGQYPAWLRMVARHVSSKSACLSVIGHQGHAGVQEAADDLSSRRATAIRLRLEAMPGMKARVASRGAGFRETLVGLGADDARDALDRRTEFRLSSCP